MRTGWLLLLCTLAGVAVGWVANELAREAPPSSGDRADDLITGGAGSAEVGLAGDGSDIHELRVPISAKDLGDPDAPGNRRARRGFAALVMLHAIRGDHDEFQRLVDLAIRAGVDPDRILDAVDQLPLERRAAAMASILARHPDVEFDDATVARIFDEGGDPERALRIVREALPNEDRFRHRLTRLLLKLDPSNGPSTLFRLEASQQWTGEDLKYLRGYLLQIGQQERLVPFLLRALDNDPGDTTALRTLGRLDPEAAADRLRSRLSMNADDVDAWSRLGGLLLRTGDANGAFDAFVRAAERRPTRRHFEALLDLDARRALPLIVKWTEGAQDDEAIGALAQAYLRAGQRQQALQVFERAHRHDPDDSEWIEGLIEIDPRRAIESLRKRVEPAPAAADDDTLGRYGRALEAAGERDAAFEQYLAAFRKDDDDHRWQIHMARLDPTRAIDVLSAHVRANPGDASGRGAYGLALEATGRKGEAADHMADALAHGDAELWYRELARIDPSRALRALRARASRDRSDRMWGALGRALEAQGRRAEARDAYRRALAADPDDSEWADALSELE